MMYWVLRSQRIFHMVDFIYNFNWCLVKSFLGMVFAISERWLFLKFFLEKWLQGIYGFLIVAALKQNISISTQWKYFVLPSLSLTLRVYVLHVCRHGGWNVISGSVQVSFQYMFRSLKNTQDEEPFHIKWRRHQDYCGLQIHHRGSSEASCLHHTKKLDLSCASCDENDHFLYMSSRLLAMQKPWLQAFSDCISDVTDLFDPITTAMQFRVIDSNGLYWLSHEVHLHVVRYLSLFIITP